MSRGTDTGFGIRDLPQESTIKAKIRPLGQNRDFLGSFLDLSRHNFHANAKKTGKKGKQNAVLSRRFPFQTILWSEGVRGHDSMKYTHMIH